MEAGEQGLGQRQGEDKRWLAVDHVGTLLQRVGHGGLAALGLEGSHVGEGGTPLWRRASKGKGKVKGREDKPWRGSGSTIDHVGVPFNR